MDDDWMELGDVARLLGRTERQVLRYAKAGKVATRRDGRRQLYRRDDVETLADALGPDVATRPDLVTADVGRALVEVVTVQRDLIEAQRQLLAAQSEIAQLRAQRQRYIAIIRELQKRAK
jgi:hypothetical protein